MKYFFDNKTAPYSGKELSPLRNYLQYGLLGPSIVSWVGPCRVELAEMVDGEDVRAKSEIASEQMVHFIMELYDVPLVVGVLAQRLFAEKIIYVLCELSECVTANDFVRDGDDVFFKNKKLNISIATRSVNSVLIHVGVNVVNDGTPVPTSALADMQVNAKAFSEAVMKSFSAEWVDVVNATYKVRTV